MDFAETSHLNGIDNKESMKTKIFLFALALAVILVRQTAAQSPIYSTNNEVVQTLAGFGIPGYVDGQGQFTEFSNPTQIVSDTASNLYVWDSGNFRIRKITPNGTVSTFAGGGINFDGYGTNASLAWGSVGGMGTVPFVVWSHLVARGRAFGCREN